MSSAEHILSYAQTLRGGGVERALLRLAGEWITLGRRVTLVIGAPDGPLARELPDRAKVVPLGSPDYRALLSLPRHIRAQRPDVIFCAGSHYTGVAAWTRWRLGRQTPPIVGKVSNALVRPDHGAATGLAHALWLRQHPRFLDRVVAMTPASAVQTAAMMRLSPSLIPIIPNPPARPMVGAAPLGLPLPPRYMLGVGRLAPQKRWDRLVTAVAAMRERVPLVILGEGEQRESLAAQARALGVELLLPGHAADPLPVMAGAALVALTSDFEGTPGVLREALSVGTPVVATDSSPAVAEIIADPAWGTMVPREDPAALIVALDRWMVAPRPEPVTPPGNDSAARYLALFDSLMPA
ncbi:glycosyltransferase [Sphingomonas sp.]|jgi:glycosyltransferase involved in cell wall biosynthesis|uniref:glycosyltransferase n=1 Tax=Sphingomonas sp. TaxID=28214 RepID=UPI002601C36A|nr:glycosyltransferase [Sphingomonas sp.]MDF2493971.1 glycosyltransferase [Sphingomonas sp.]